MAAFDQEEFEEVLKDLDDEHQRIDRAPSTDELLGPFSVICLFLNRTIGSGIFISPGKILAGTGSVGASLLIWTLGALIHLCGLLVWLELGLSIPFRTIPGTTVKTSVPRSGGELNYLQFIYSRSPLLTACMFGIPYVILGNLSGNSIAIGKFIMEAAGREPEKSPVIGIAIVVLTAAVMVHVCSRRGGIMVNNAITVLKVLLLLAIVILGFVKAGGHLLGGAPPAKQNFKIDQSFSGPQRGVVSYTRALIYVIYPYSGFQQPFYVLSEVRHPRRVFPKATLAAFVIGTLLFMLVNISYFLVVPKEVQLASPEVPMASLFLDYMFGDSIGKRVMSGLMAFSVFGNIVVMTFTASRVKQEIAKEGVLPFSLFFATSVTTPWAWYQARRNKNKESSDREDVQPEQTPMPALGLHWAMSVFMVGVTSMLPPTTSYTVLVELYAYVVRLLVPLAVTGGLLYLKFRRSLLWSTRANFMPWLTPAHAVFYFLTLGFVAIASFVKPKADTPFTSEAGHITWFIIPTVGLSSISWGVIWFLGLKVVMWSRNRVLTVTRTPCIVPDGDGQWVQRAEFVEHEWHTRTHGPNHDPNDEAALETGSFGSGSL